MCSNSRPLSEVLDHHQLSVHATRRLRVWWLCTRGQGAPVLLDAMAPGLVPRTASHRTAAPSPALLAAASLAPRPAESSTSGMRVAPTVPHATACGAVAARAVRRGAWLMRRWSAERRPSPVARRWARRRGKCGAAVPRGAAWRRPPCTPATGWARPEARGGRASAWMTAAATPGRGPGRCTRLRWPRCVRRGGHAGGRRC